MQCNRPLHGYLSQTVNASGKRSVVFNMREGFHDRPMSVPCGQCMGCRLEKSRQWAMRCMHEASMHEENCFITLTYNNESLPHLGSLVKRDFQLFMKRLRKKYNGRSIRYYHCGEYGEFNGRPHYHACLFGHDFEDKTLWTVRNGFRVWRSEILESLWTNPDTGESYGLSEIGSLTFESAAYVARYVTKKYTNALDKESEKNHYAVVDNDGVVVGYRHPEYSTMSRRPGIGLEWFKKYKREVMDNDRVIFRGKEMKPPVYYEGQWEIDEKESYDKMKKARIRAHNPEDAEWDRENAREAILEAKAKLYESRNL